ncbi:hypothetical protein H5T88_08140 [bacterium]|nr:hypothetical protein [bacterium]
MIYFLYAPHFLFSFTWNVKPRKLSCVYFTFCSQYSPTGINHFLSGLVAQTDVARYLCPSPTGEFSETNEPQSNPIETDFLYTDWLTRTPSTYEGTPMSMVPGSLAFLFGDHGTFSVLVDFIGKGGRELWRINAGGKMACGWYKNKQGELVWVEYPKEGEYSYQGEREITDLWEKAKAIGGMGFPQLLTRQAYCRDEHTITVSLPTLTALLPYKEGGHIHLFDYPDPEFSSDKLAELISIEVVSSKEWDIYYPPGTTIEHLGHKRSESILLNLAYRAWDIFLPFAIPIPRPEGMWIMTLSKSLKDKKRIERKTTTREPWVYQVENYPIWEYTADWYLANPLGVSFQKRTTIPKSSETSFIWFLYPLLKTSGELGVYVYEIDYLARNWYNKCDLYAGIYLASGRKLVYDPSDTQNVPDPNNLILYPQRDYPNYLNFQNVWSLIYYWLNNPATKHRRYTQCFSAIPPYPSFPIGRASPGPTYNWHTATGNFLTITTGWDEEGNYRWYSRDYQGLWVTEGAVDVNVPPPDVLNAKLGEPISESIFLSFLQRPEMPETILFWFQPEDPNFSYILSTYWNHLLTVLDHYPIGAPLNGYVPWEFYLAPKDPRPITWGKLKMLVWRKGEGVVAERDLGRYPIQYLLPAIEKQTGAVYLPLMADMRGDGSGIFKLFIFRRNDWSPDIYDLGGE